MNTATALPSEVAAVVAAIDPDNYAAGTQTSGWVAVKDFMSFMALIQVGEMAAGSTVDAKIEQATDSGGSNSKDVSNSSITQLTQASNDDSDQQVAINVRPEHLDVSGGFSHIRMSITVASAASDAGAVLLGLNARHGPASDQDADTVAEIVTAG